MRAWFTREDAVRYMALNNTQQKSLREKYKIKLTPNPSRPSIKTGYTPKEFVRLANVAGWAILEYMQKGDFVGKTVFVKMDRVFDERLFSDGGCSKCEFADITNMPKPRGRKSV